LSSPWSIFHGFFFSAQITQANPMSSKIWNILVLTVLALTVVSFLFLFEEKKVDPKLFNVPFAFWSGFLVTVLIVILTFLASRYFPHQESDKK
jgi:hypothetical protein